MFDNGLSLLVGDPPRTYSTILKPRPPVESRGLQITNEMRIEQLGLVNFILREINAESNLSTTW